MHCGWLLLTSIDFFCCWHYTLLFSMRGYAWCDYWLHVYSLRVYRLRDYSLRNSGKAMTSLIAGESVRTMTSRSIPMPSPAVGGMPLVTRERGDRRKRGEWGGERGVKGGGVRGALQWGACHWWQGREVTEERGVSEGVRGEWRGGAREWCIGRIE